MPSAAAARGQVGAASRSAQVVRRAADRLVPAHQEIRDALRQVDRLKADDSGWRVGGMSIWLHV